MNMSSEDQKNMIEAMKVMQGICFESYPDCYDNCPFSNDCSFSNDSDDVEYPACWTIPEVQDD